MRSLGFSGHGLLLISPFSPCAYKRRVVDSSPDSDEPPGSKGDLIKELLRMIDINYDREFRLINYGIPSSAYKRNKQTCIARHATYFH